MVIKLLVGSAVVGIGVGTYLTRKLTKYYEKNISKLSALEKIGASIVIVGFTTMASIMPATAYLHTDVQKKKLEEQVMIEIKNKNYEQAEKIIEKQEKYNAKTPIIIESKMNETINHLTELIEESKYSAN